MGKYSGWVTYIALQCTYSFNCIIPQCDNGFSWSFIITVSWLEEFISNRNLLVTYECSMKQ